MQHNDMKFDVLSLSPNYGNPEKCGSCLLDISSCLEKMLQAPIVCFTNGDLTNKNDATMGYTVQLFEDLMGRKWDLPIYWRSTMTEKSLKNMGT